jgi:hypothetical protein
MDYPSSEYLLGYRASTYILIQLGGQGYHIIRIHEYPFISLVPPCYPWSHVVLTNSLFIPFVGLRLKLLGI